LPARNTDVERRRSSFQDRHFKPANDARSRQNVAVVRTAAIDLEQRFVMTRPFSLLVLLTA
jgi:hypothetical protein